MTAKEQARAYRIYLASDHWRHLKDERQANRAMGRFKRCEKCGSCEKVEGHHVLYRNLIDCTWRDIQLLCQRCHQTLHRASHSVKMKSLHSEKKEQGKRWIETVSALVRKFRKSPTENQLDTLIADLTAFRGGMK